MEFKVNQIVKINKNLTYHNKIAHGLKINDIVKIVKIDEIKQRALIKDQNGEWSIKLIALDKLN
jgi:hypothetical protein